uniref:Reverse transcriptase Ty1/copia-type domain-containing protein n=1 Tax=Solanum lycopersicum TaxID=4081 RepID=A0A3Q7IWF6_SOLLC
MAVSTSTNGADTPFADITHFRSLIGALQYLDITRPDIQFAVNRVAQRMHQPSEHDYHCLKCILRYIFGTLSRGLLIRPGDLDLPGFSNSDWANDKNDRKSTSGFLVFLGPNLISWCTKKQPKVSPSSTETEYRALSLLAAETIIPIDHCVFVQKFSDNDFIILLLYVDDMLIVGKNTSKIHELNKELCKSFSMKDLGHAKQILCMRITRLRDKGRFICPRRSTLNVYWSASI